AGARARRSSWTPASPPTAPSTSPRTASRAARCSPASASTTRAPSQRCRRPRTRSASSPGPGRLRLFTPAARRRALMAVIEPFLSVRREGRVVNLLDPESTIKSISVASALGGSSAHTWLKLPVVDELERVMDATTLPTLLLGGDPQGDPHDTYASWGHALDLPPVS